MRGHVKAAGFEQVAEPGLVEAAFVSHGFVERAEELWTLRHEYEQHASRLQAVPRQRRSWPPGSSTYSSTFRQSTVSTRSGTAAKSEGLPGIEAPAPGRSGPQKPIAQRVQV